ncbi:SHOCT domain-containing protein [Salinadaptatus halalkaliphilus]|uniref:SHOCT domain-containing protein n=1 Tax=Salinadaptatus halalkaliphilus TaxID=2419781 RepID=A0A4S3TMH1_9EURY|nr:SHOCT domain-containing protein [Salinadaptatus halalkaliphilus]THE65336.1 SHOCT domain-containing protein [Salinadaptatus halalkaliphilus]
MSDDPVTRLRDNVTEVTAMVLTGLWLLGLFTGQWWWLPLLLVSYVVIIPMVALLFGDEADHEEWWDWSDTASWDDEAESSGSADDRPTRADASESSPGDALETLRDRYAAGELTDAQFERKLERLLETETIEDADRWRHDAREERDRRHERPTQSTDTTDGPRERELERDPN